MPDLDLGRHAPSNLPEQWHEGGDWKPQAADGRRRDQVLGLKRKMAEVPVSKLSGFRSGSLRDHSDGAARLRRNLFGFPAQRTSCLPTHPPPVADCEACPRIDSSAASLAIKSALLERSRAWRGQLSPAVAKLFARLRGRTELSRREA